MLDNYNYLHRPGFNPSSRATYIIFHPSTNNFYMTMSVGRALLLNPGSTLWFRRYHVHKLISIHVHCDIDLWPSKSIGSILSPWLTCLSSLIKKSTTVQSLLCSQAYFHTCPLWPWPLTSKINRVHPLVMVNMSAKFDKEICNSVVSIVFTRSMHGRNHGRTDWRTETQLRYYTEQKKKVSTLFIFP